MVGWMDRQIDRYIYIYIYKKKNRYVEKEIDGLMDADGKIDRWMGGT